MRFHYPCGMRPLGEDAKRAFGERMAKKTGTGDGIEEAVKRFLLVRKNPFHMEELTTDARDRADRRSLAAVEHFFFDTRELPGDMVHVVAHCGIQMRKKHLKKNIGRNRHFPYDELLCLNELLEVMQGCDDLIAHGDDKILSNDEIDFLAFRFALFLALRREVENKKQHIVTGDYRGYGSRQEKLALHPFVDGEFFRYLPDFIRAWLFQIDPDAAQIFVPEYHAPRIPCPASGHCRARTRRCDEASCATLCKMESDTARGQSIVMRGISFALVAAIAFGAGVAAGSNGSAASIASHIPLVGDGLDATPDASVDLANFWKAWNALEEHYVITQASSTLPTVKDRLYGAIEGLASSYGDPYTVFFPPEEAKQFADTISGSFAGVGMEIDVKDGVLTVIAPLKGTPAEAAGVKAGDQIVAIDGKSTDGLSIDKAVTKIRGPIGTTVEITVVRGGKTFNFKIVRDTIQVPETDDGLDAASGVYRIALYEFTANSANLFNLAFERFRNSGSKKLVLDLRGNPGGYLDSAVDIASHFLPKGADIVTEDFDGKEPKQAHTSLGYSDVPRGTKIVMLIDGGSASASEILAGALQDNRAATLIGTRSFGKGSVQTLLDLDKGSLKITVARWITPAGHWIMGNGITPDIVVPFTQEDAAAGKDPQMARAVQFLTTGK